MTTTTREVSTKIDTEITFEPIGYHALISGTDVELSRCTGKNPSSRDWCDRPRRNGQPEPAHWHVSASSAASQRWVGTFATEDAAKQAARTLGALVKELDDAHEHGYAVEEAIHALFGRRVVEDVPF